MKPAVPTDSNMEGCPPAVVVGGTRGFGAAVSRRLSEHGFAVTVIGRSQPPAGIGGHHECDISDKYAWVTTVEDALARVPKPLQVLIYIVGYARVFPFDATPLAEWDRHLWLNFTHVAYSLPLFERILATDAKIATTGSQWSHQKGWRDLIPYISAKHALAALTGEYATDFPGRVFRHYCVPTMQTRGYESVVESATSSSATLHARSAPEVPTNPELVASAYVDDLLAASPANLVLRDIDRLGRITAPDQT